METPSYVLATLTMFILAPFSIAPATAQMSIGVDREDPQMWVGQEERGLYRDENRRRHDGWRNQFDCREVTMRKRGPDGWRTGRIDEHVDDASWRLGNIDRTGADRDPGSIEIGEWMRCRAKVF